jgi:uncharacterized membrane protein YdbT with pleckstrin-like domain
MGKYIQNSLLNDERVVYETHLHWIIFISWQSLFTLLMAPLLRRLSSEFAVTNRRLIIKTGLLSRHTLEMNLSKIESVNIDQSLSGHVLDYGSLTVIGTGGTHEVFHLIAHPMELRRQCQAYQA